MIYEVDDPSWIIKAFFDDEVIPPGPSISIVQHKSIAGTAGATQTLAYTSNNTAGHMLIYAAGGNGAGVTASWSDSGNTIVSVNTATTPGSGAVAYVSSCVGGANTVSVTMTGEQRIHLHIWEISGVSTLDQHTTSTQAATSQSLSTPSSTSFANELVFGFFYDQPNDDSLSAGSGFSTSEFKDGGAGNESSLSEAKIVASTGVQTVTATCGSASNTIMQFIATFH